MADKPSTTESDRPTGDEQDRRSGSDLPHASGAVSDEDVNSVTGGEHNRNAATGKDHSLDDYGESMPESGVGAIQNHSDTTSDIAHIED